MRANVYLVGVSRLISDQATWAWITTPLPRSRFDEVLLPECAGIASVRLLGYAGFPVTQHNGSKFLAWQHDRDRPTAELEQRLGFVREGSFSSYDQLLSRQQRRGSRQTTGLNTSVLPGVSVSNFGDYDQYSPTSTSAGRYARAFVDMGYYQNRLKPQPTSSLRPQAHDVQWRL